jgi:hypothetical protein
MQKNTVLKNINTRLRQPLAGPGKNLSTFISRHLASIIGWMLASLFCQIGLKMTIDLVTSCLGRITEGVHQPCLEKTADVLSCANLNSCKPKYIFCAVG